MFVINQNRSRNVKNIADRLYIVKFASTFGSLIATSGSSELRMWQFRISVIPGYLHDLLILNIYSMNRHCKTMLITACLLIFFQTVQAQVPFYPAKSGIKMSTVLKDAKGKETNYTETELVSVDFQDEQNYAVKSVVLTLDAKKKPVTPEPAEVTLEVIDGKVKFDPSALLGPVAKDVELTGEVFMLPATVSVGDTFGDYGMKAKVGPVATTISVSNIRTTGNETLLVAENPVECYIVESDIAVKVMGISQQMSQKIWYGRGIGPVKTEIYQKGKLQSSKELVSITDV